MAKKREPVPGLGKVRPSESVDLSPLVKDDDARSIWALTRRVQRLEVIHHGFEAVVLRLEHVLDASLRQGLRGFWGRLKWLVTGK